MPVGQPVLQRESTSLLYTKESTIVVKCKNIYGVITKTNIYGNVHHSNASTHHTQYTPVRAHIAHSPFQHEHTSQSHRHHHHSNHHPCWPLQELTTVFRPQFLMLASSLLVMGMTTVCNACIICTGHSWS